MSGAMRRIGEYLGLLEDTGRYDEYGDEFSDDQTRVTREVAKAEPAPRPRREGGPAPVADLNERRRAAPVAAVPVAAVHTPLSTITTVSPSTYNDARVVGEHFREGTPVIMNLTEMGDEEAKRLVDFAAGLVFATHGKIERVTSKVFLLSPQNVSVAQEDKERIAEDGFFNQS